MNHTSQTTPHKRGRGSLETSGTVSNCQKSQPSNTPNRTISYLSDWRDDVEIRSSEGNAGRSERMLADGILRLDRGPNFFASIPELCEISSLGKSAVRHALERMHGHGMLRYQSNRGRGQKTAIELMMRGLRHGR